MHRDPVKVEIGLRDAVRTLADARDNLQATQVLLGMFFSRFERDSMEHAMLTEIASRTDEVWSAMREAEQDVARAY